MRIIVGSIQQETNTLSPIKTTLKDFDCAYGKSMLDRINVTGIFRDAGAYLIPTIYCNALPGGIISKDDFLRLEDSITEAIKKEAPGRIDGIWLYMHGAMFVEKIGSGERHILQRIRDITGYEVPVAVALDFHANNTNEIIKLANIICGYRTAPHRDMAQTEQKAARLLLECIKKNILPRPALARANVIVAGDMVQTENEPLKSIFMQADIIESKPGFLCAEVFNGQPWVDAEYTGPSAIVIHETDQRLAQKEADQLMKVFYEKRHDFRFNVDATDASDAIKIAINHEQKPVFITDSGDNTTAGAAGDNAYMLNRILENKKILENKAKKVLFGGIMDYKAVDICNKSNIGDIISLRIGGLLDQRSEAAQIRCRLLNRSKILGWYGEDAGHAAIVRTGYITIIITEARTAFIRPEIFKSVGINIYDYDIVIVKLGYLFPDLEKIASKAILALTPGASTEQLIDMGHKKIRRPMYPLDDNFI